MTLRFRLGALLLLLVLSGFQASWAKTAPAAPATTSATAPDINAPLTPLAATQVYDKTTRAVVNELAQHYSHLAFDDALSQRLLEQYLKTLDPSRLYFLKADVDGFQKYRDQLDDQLSDGDLDAGYAIFNVYQQRAMERLQFLLGLLHKGVDKLDYKSKDSVLLDRSKAPWVDGKKAMDDLWRRRLINDVISMRLDDVKDSEISERLTRRYKNQLKRLHQTTAEDVFQIYINALCALYDPHTNYFTPEKLTSFNIDMSHSLEGIGAVLQGSDGYTKIVRLVPGGPAATSGKLKPADRIIGVGQGIKGEITNIIGWRLDEVVQLIRGPKNSKVRLEIMPASATSEHTTHVITLTRDKIKLEAQAAKKKVLEVTSHGQTFRIGVITLPAFYQDFDAYRRGDPNYTSSYRDVKKLVNELKKEKVDGLVMDLRNNGGGSLFEAIRLVSLFVDGGPTVQIRSADGDVRVENDVYPGTLYQGPMAVLVNRFSASASEIFTGAMQDYGRALIVGGDTFGKGTVQTLLDLNYGDIKITEAKFYRVSGSSNQLKGIIPDISLPFIVNKEDIGESALPNALPWDHIAAADYTPMFNFGPYLDELVKAHDARVAKQSDFIYAIAMDKLLQANKTRKSLSLNQEERGTLRKQLDADTLAIENQRRSAEGEKPLASMDALRKLEDEKSLDPEDASADKPDAYLKETGMILGDLVALMKDKKLAATDYWK